MIYVGIDTGTHTGYAEWNAKEKRFLSVDSVKIHQAMERIRNLAESHPDSLMVRVEDPRQRTWFGTERMPRDEERKKLQGVGAVKRDASIWEDFLKDLGVQFEMVPPRQNVTKLSQETFRSYTGWKKKTNEHGRDAAMLVFGF